MKEKFDVEGMTCAACQAHVEKAVKNLSGVKNCNVNLLKNSMEVEFENIEIKDIEAAVSNAGYKAFLHGKKEITEEKKDASLIRLIISGIFLILLMYFSMGVMMWHFPTFDVFDMEKNPMGFALIQFILLLPIVYFERDYFIRGFKVLFKGPTMDSLIAIGATASILYSLVMLFLIPYDSKYHMSLYFEAAGMILVFVSIGKYLEKLSKRRTTKALESLMDLAPKTANVVIDGKEVVMPVEDVKCDDIVICRKGDLVPIDGVVIKGTGSINQANITGESVPVYKKENGIVYQSTIVESGYLEIKATKVGEDTTFATIIKLVEEAANSKAPISKLADRISYFFVPIVFLISILVFLGNFLYIQFGNPSYAVNAFNIAFNYAITVIVIACPCALGLATPVAIMVGMGVGASNGLIIKNAEILEQTGKIEVVILDKTGTITEGHPKVTDIFLESKYYDYIYALEKNSNHPLSLAILDYLNNKIQNEYEVSNYEAIDGMGIKGIIDNHTYYIGNASGIKNLDKDYSNLENEGKTVLYISYDEKLIGALAIKDEIKENSKEAISLLRQKNIEVIMLTGDNEKTAKAIASEIGIQNVIANVTPKDKADVITKYKNKGKIVCMVGDGVNDAPALALSDLGIAIGGGSDVARETSDIVLVRNDLLDVVNAIHLSKRVLATIKSGLFFAFFYNIICIFLASGILYHITKGQFQMKPEYGSMLMSLSSVSVVLNALSINLFKMKKKEEKKEEEKTMEATIQVEGMMCKHCKAHVEKACLGVDGVTNALASVEDKNVVVTLSKDVDLNEIKKAINEAGYEAK